MILIDNFSTCMSSRGIEGSSYLQTPAVVLSTPIHEVIRLQLCRCGWQCAIMSVKPPWCKFGSLHMFAPIARGISESFELSTNIVMITPEISFAKQCDRNQIYKLQHIPGSRVFSRKSLHSAEPRFHATSLEIIVKISREISSSSGNGQSQADCHRGDLLVRESY